MKQFDYLVVGGGLAGLYTAFHLSSYGKVGLLTRDKLCDSNSYFAQGGMAAVTDQKDSPQEHYDDTLVAGRGLCLSDSVKILVEEAPRRIQELIDMGMNFDHEGGKLTLGLEGGHHHHRILHAGGDATGRMVTSFMIEKVLSSKSIDILDHHLLLDLCINEQGCCGIESYNTEAHSRDFYCSRATILATGGLGALYYPTTNPPSACGDGIALALEKGAKVMDLEFIQFHPTALALEGVDSFLISEAVRGEGAYLLNQEGKRFMLGRHPLAELAPRDVVAAAIYEEMMQSHSSSVTLSLKHLDGEKLRKRFPTITQHCEDLGLDFTDSIPVAPAAHYTVGGIATDTQGKTSIPRLYAVGEVASTGMMGANRLASNSLIECLVMGYRLAREIGEKDIPLFAFSEMKWKEKKSQRDSFLEMSEGEYCSFMRKIGETLMSYVGIVRTKEGLNRAIQIFTTLQKELTDKKEYSIQGVLLQRRLNLVLWIAKAALAREETRGNHHRKDFPQTLPREATYRTELFKNHLTRSFL